MVSQYSINPTEEGMLSEGKSDPTLLGREEEENRALSIATRFGYGLLVPAILIFESVVTILINGSSPELKKRCSRIFVNNLAISGAFIGVVSFVMTFFVIDSFRDIAVSCNLEILPFYWTLTYLHMVSVTSLLCLSFDRYLAICWPLRYHEFLTTARCRNMVVACWVLSLACLLVPTLSRYISLVAFQNKSDSLRQVSNSPSFSSSDASRIMKSSAATDCQTRGNRTSREMELWLTCRRAFTVSFGVSYFFSLFLILCMYALVMREFCLLNRRVHATTTSMEKEDQRARIKSTRDLILVATLYLTLSLPHMILHPEYVNKTVVNDIAILKMEEPIPFDVKNTVSPVCLPEDPNNKYENAEVFVCGWGYTIAGNDESQSPVLLHTVMKTMANPSCNKELFPFGGVRDDQICTQTSGKSQGLPCNGDSGGPLMYQHGTHVDQIAIVSYGITKCTRGYPEIFTRVTSYLDWIRSHIGRP